MSEPRIVDAAKLPDYAFGSSSPTWWGTIGMMVVEGMLFALTIMSYFYLRSQAPDWPIRAPPPDLLWGTLNTALMILSGVPNAWTKRCAERFDHQRVRRGLWLCTLVGVLLMAVRVGEFATLNVRWDDNAYGSVVWMLMGLHTTHLITDTYNTGVLAVLFSRGPLEAKRFVDVSENAGYWYFVLISWLAVYAVVFWGARL
ncbi:heme/copper-type cytochrome/quinol oxidase subunit 3 [Duganella sp. SG902]|uniref:cytochrome c oxidase subunit 3 n=1 Tax=Duganella sp. SG902 TaxID=2587016 RepID=UPI00159EAF51|nr:cytochrome c oxidase subunit 3 [Duganella sp. SG902]NVM77199.1 heme/copper-type cytochrome/quinol oxidase subunit 3 [Duganella sp. SG902]